MDLFKYARLFKPANEASLHAEYQVQLRDDGANRIATKSSQSSRFLILSPYERAKEAAEAFYLLRRAHLARPSHVTFILNNVRT